MKALIGLRDWVELPGTGCNLVQLFYRGTLYSFRLPGLFEIRFNLAESDQ